MPLTDPMKPTPKSRPELAPLLAFGAHPDDIEFGCGGVIAKETRAGRKAHFVICSRGEAGHSRHAGATRGRGKKSAALLGATIEFLELDGDAHLEVRAAHAIKLAGIIRRVRPGIVLAPSLVENQHPDHGGWDNSCATPPAGPLRRRQGIAPGAGRTRLNNCFFTR
jgi:LmbE family N-acetylglucosaminyl deacetylase